MSGMKKHALHFRATAKGRRPFLAEENEDEEVNAPPGMPLQSPPPPPSVKEAPSDSLKQELAKKRRSRKNRESTPSDGIPAASIPQHLDTQRDEQQVSSASMQQSSMGVGAFHVAGIQSSSHYDGALASSMTANSVDEESSRNNFAGDEEQPTLIEAHLVKNQSIIIHGVTPEPMEPLIRRYRWLLALAVLIAVTAIITTVLTLVLRPGNSSKSLSTMPSFAPSQAPTAQESAVPSFIPSHLPTMPPSTVPTLLPTAVTWLQLGQPLMAQNPNNSTLFGSTFAISNNGTILVVLEGNSDTIQFVVTAFSHDGADWNQLGSPIVSNETSASDASLALSNSGMTFVVRYSLHDDGGDDVLSDGGQVRVFTFNGVDWDEVLRVNGSAELGSFDGAVAISGDGSTVAVTSLSGIRVFRLNNVYLMSNATWEQRGNVITDSSCGFYDGFGFDIDLSEDGDTLVVGGEECPSADGRPDSGLLKVFAWFEDSGNWFPKGQELYGTETGGEFGRSVALSGTGNIVAGSAWKGDSADSSGSRVGYVEVWIYNADDRSWDRMGEPLYGDEEFEGFGRSMDLSLDGLSLVVGVRNYPGVGGFSGGVQMFRFTDGGWSKLGQTLIGTEADDEFGENVAISGDGQSVVAGALGHIRVFSP